MNQSSIHTIVFDLGGVLIDWNPHYLYKKIFTDEQEMLTFLSTICTPDWNEEQDAGRSLQEATTLLVNQYPAFTTQIQAFYSRWEEMLGGAMEETVEILSRIKESNRYRLYALTNWSDETFPIALQRFEFLHWFEGIVVSGKEKTRKPFPEIFQIMTERFSMDIPHTLFIDDNARNIEGAKAQGFQTILFQSAQQLQKELQNVGIAV